MSRQVVLSIAVLLSGCVTVVPAGFVGVKWTPSGVSPGALQEGSHVAAPWDALAIYDARSQEHDEKLEVLAVNGLRLTLDASIRYHLVPEEVVTLHRMVGSEYYAILLGPTLRSQARRVVGRYSPEQIYSTQRELIEREIREGIEKALEGRHVRLEAVLIRNVTLPPEIQRAINDKLEAEQRSLKEKYLIEMAEKEAERQKIEAEAAAARVKIAAEGEAESRRIAAKATADANELLEQHITDKVLKWQQLQSISRLAEAPNAKVILLPEGKTAPLLQLP